MKGLWAFFRHDTLTKRLFLLMWLALMLSHFIGFWFAHAGGPWGWLPHWSAIPPIPSLPPLSVGTSGPGGPMGMPPGGRMHWGGPPNLWVDWLARIVITGAASWLGARWLTAPMRELAKAAQALTPALGRHEALPILDERAGTLEVRQTARVFNEMAHQLRDQFDERGLLMAALSHDLRTPLTRLRIRLERLQPDSVAERCVADVQDVNAMIEAVLDALNEERSQEAAQDVDVLALVEALADDLAEQGHPVAASGDQATLRVQPVAIRRVLDNLVSNALRHGNEALIRVKAEAGRVRITVDDKGPGIPPDQLDKVFKPFVRLDTSRARDTGDTGGVGLGLYIARELTLRNGGKILLRNLAQGGLRAQLSFPVVTESAS